MDMEKIQQYLELITDDSVKPKPKITTKLGFERFIYNLFLKRSLKIEQKFKNSVWNEFITEAGENDDFIEFLNKNDFGIDTTNNSLIKYDLVPDDFLDTRYEELKLLLRKEHILTISKIIEQEFSGDYEKYMNCSVTLDTKDKILYYSVKISWYRDIFIQQLQEKIKNRFFKFKIFGFVIGGLSIISFLVFMCIKLFMK